MDNLNEILEAILFTSGNSRKITEIMQLLPSANRKEFDLAINYLKEKYNESSGIVLLNFNDKLQLSTNPKYGEIVAEVLTPIKEKELSKTLLEVLAIIAYKQPITRLEIEKIKSTSAEYALGVLLKTNLIAVIGRKEVVGRPVLYGTTDEFLIKFQLEQISDLPDFESVMERLELMGVFNHNQVGLYRDIDISDEKWQRENPDMEELVREERFKELERNLDATKVVDDFLSDEDEIPEFLKGEDFKVIE